MFHSSAFFGIMQACPASSPIQEKNHEWENIYTHNIEHQQHNHAESAPCMDVLSTRCTPAPQTSALRSLFRHRTIIYIPTSMTVLPPHIRHTNNGIRFEKYDGACGSWRWASYIRTVMPKVGISIPPLESFVHT